MQAEPIVLPGGRHACLLFHGAASTPLELRFIGKLLQRAGFSVHIPVLPGYSMGSAPGRWQEWLERAHEAFAALQARHGSVCVGGISMGATLALALAEHEPRLQSLALWAVTLRYDGWAVPWYQWLLGPCYRLGIGRGYVYREREPFGLKNERWRARVAEAMRSRGASAAGPAEIAAPYLYEGALLGRAAVRRLAQVSCDTLVVHAADDETAAPGNAEDVLHGIRARRKRRILLGDSYHLVTMDNERDLVARETIRFFQQSVLRDHPGESLKLVSSARALLRQQRQRAVREAA